jgi:hypothetical protein
VFDKVGQAAERLASRASRRAFLGQFGKGALALAGMLGGVLAFPGRAQAGPNLYCCVYRDSVGPSAVLCSKDPCPSTYNGLTLISQSMVSNCHRCVLGGG